MRHILSLCFLLVSGTLVAGAPSEVNESLTVTSDKIYTVSSFDSIDYFTVYSLNGTPLWEVNFTSKIITWKVANDSIIILSKARNGSAYFVTSIKNDDGTMAWEKPINAPVLSLPDTIDALDPSEI